MIPLFSPVRQNEPLLAEMEQAFREFAKSGEYILGKRVTEFESKLSTQLGFKHAVGVSSGTEALNLSLKAMGVNPGDEVITPAFSFVASSNAIAWIGAIPKFADVDLETGNVTVASVEKVWSPKVKVVMAVDLYGRQAPIEALRKWCDRKGCFLLEDGAQSIGVRSRGAHLFTTSFYPTKNMGALGDAGAVLSDDTGLATRVREMSLHGGTTRDLYPQLGTNGRLDGLQAALLSIKLKHLSAWSRVRKQIAEAYIDALKPLEAQGKLWLPPTASEPESHVWSLFTIRIPERRPLKMESLRSKGVGCAVYYPKAIPDQPSMAQFGAADSPNARRLASEVLSIPIYPELSGQEIKVVVDRLFECLV